MGKLNFGKAAASLLGAMLLTLSMPFSVSAEGTSSTAEGTSSTVEVQSYSASATSKTKETYYSKTAAKGTKSDNVQLKGYNGGNWASPMRSYLYENNGYLYRLEYTGSKILLEKYDSSLKYIGKGTIEPELPIFGGFYAGKDYNFIIYGSKNYKESETAEVMRVVKYTKTMKKVSSKSFYGCNTTVPFNAGCPRMDEYNGVLYIHTSHEMFKFSDGYNHQANMDIYIRISDMSPVFMSYDPLFTSAGFVSHSLNQFIRVNENGIYTLDHGDANKRGVLAFRRPDISSFFAGYRDVFNIKGEIGNNYTGVCLGGMEMGEDNMIIAGTSVPQDSTWGSSKQENLFVISAALFDSTKTTVKYLTNYKKSDGVTFSEPKLVKTGSDSFMLLWSETKSKKTKLYVTMLDGKGNKVGKTYVYNAKISDCQPIIYNGKVIYYVTDNSCPTFYYFNADGTIAKQKADFNKK